MFSIEFSSHAKRFLKRAETELAKRILDMIEKLAEDPFPKDVKRIVNRKEKAFRIRVGDYRIQYILAYEKNIIYITDIDARSRAY